MIGDPRPHSERPRPTGMPVLRADERFVEQLADTLAERIADQLQGQDGDEGGYLTWLIANYARPYFSGKLKLIDVTTFLLARFVDWLADEDEQGKRLSDATIANIVIPLRAALTTAKREGLIRHDPSLGLALPHREQFADEEEEIKVFSREQLAAILAMAPERHRLLFEVLATCGLRGVRRRRGPGP